MTTQGNIGVVKRTHLDCRLDCHHLEDIKHLGARLERFVRDYCTDGLVETVWMVDL